MRRRNQSKKYLRSLALVREVKGIEKGRATYNLGKRLLIRLQPVRLKLQSKKHVRCPCCWTEQFPLLAWCLESWQWNYTEVKDLVHTEGVWVEDIWRKGNKEVKRRVQGELLPVLFKAEPNWNSADIIVQGSWWRKADQSVACIFVLNVRDESEWQRRIRNHGMRYRWRRREMRLFGNCDRILLIMDVWKDCCLMLQHKKKSVTIKPVWRGEALGVPESEQNSCGCEWCKGEDDKGRAKRALQNWKDWGEGTCGGAGCVQIIGGF